MRFLIFIALTVACFWYSNAHDTFRGGVVFCCGINFAWAFLKGFGDAAIKDYRSARERRPRPDFARTERPGLSFTPRGRPR